MAIAKKFEVGVWNLHVIVTNDDGGWFAQGAEIDYAAQGATLEDAKKHFEAGLAATIHEHLKLHEKLDYFVRPAPPEVWQEIARGAERKLLLTQISRHMLLPAPFQGIEYLMSPAPMEPDAVPA